MNEATLPPSPNWYLGNILACAKDGTVAWGARNAIVVATADPDKKIHKYSIINDAHIDRVTSLAFSPKFGEKGERLLVSCGDENVIRIWNLDSMSTVMAHSYMDTQQKVAGVDWSKANSNIVCCVATDGSLVVWNLHHNVAQQMSLGKLTATCLSCCPHDPELVAVGTKSGLVFVVNVHGAGKVVYKLRGHDAEISSLSWCPIETNVSTGSEARDLLLASGGKDRSIFIWKAGGDGRYQIELTLPSTPLDSRQHRSKLGTATGGWTAVCWAAPKVLLTSSSWGELLSWDLATGSTSRTACKLIHACHSRGLFCIASVQEDTRSVDDNWRSKDTRSIVVWTLAQDRRVVRSEVKALDSEVTYNVMTQGGYIYCIAASPLDTSRVAFGVGDAMLRLWSLCEPHENTFDITMLWQKIKGKVMSISWHPEKENFLAFGTGEGRVGVFDTNGSKPPILYRQYHRHAVYTLGWGPQPNGRSGHVLYSCGDGELVYYDPEKPNQEPKSVIKKDCTEFSWKPDGSCLVVGFENGSISILNRDLEECGSTIHSLKKAVQCFAWHPESTSTDPNLSPLRHQLAVSTNAQTIALFDLTDVVEGYTSTGDTTTAIGKLPSHKIIGSLSGHTAKVVDLAWSPHISGYLASASYDNTVQVWKTESQELIGTYTSHCGPVYCCMWSPLDPDFILTGSADFTVRIWRLSEQAVRLPVENSTKPKKVRTKKNKHKVEKIAVAQASDREEGNPDGPEVDAAKITNVEYATSERDIRAFLAMDQIKRKKNKKLTYFPVMAKAVNDKGTVLDSIMNSVQNSHQMSDRELDCTSVIERTDDASAGGTSDKVSLGLSIFGSREQVLRLLETESKRRLQLNLAFNPMYRDSSRIRESAHAKLSQHDTVVEMDLWCNNLKQNLQAAAKAKRLNDFLVSLAPSLSFKVWQETCETYAAQLEFEGNHRKAVSYLLCIHKIDRAIQVFAEAKMFREAYVLAKCKLDPTDPLVDSLLAAWAIGAAREGNFEDAVQCCIKLGNYKEAAKYLSKRRDSRSLDVAARLASKSGDEEYSATLAEQAVTEALLKADYDSAENIIEAFPQIQYYKVITGALREMDRILESSDDGQIWDWLEGNAKESILKNLLKRYPDCNRYYELLLKSCATLQGLADKSMLWIEAGKQIAVATACTAGERQIHHLVGVMGAVSRYETVCVQSSHSKSEMNGKQSNVFAKLLSHLREINPCSEHGVSANKEPSIHIHKSLRAYICYGILNWLLESDVGQIEGSRKELVESLIENLIGDALDKQTVKYNLISAEVNKLEGSLAVAMGKSNDVGEIGDSAKENVENLMERLVEIRNEKDKFLTDRLHAPNPVLVYSKARELTSILFEGETREKLTNLLTFTWTEATS